MAVSQSWWDKFQVLCKNNFTEVFLEANDLLKVFSYKLFQITADCIPKSKPNSKLAASSRKKALKLFCRFPLKLMYGATDLKELKLDWSFDVASEKVGRIMYQCWDMIRKIAGNVGGFTAIWTTMACLFWSQSKLPTQSVKQFPTIPHQQSTSANFRDLNKYKKDKTWILLRRIQYTTISYLQFRNLNKDDSSWFCSRVGQYSLSSP